MSEELEIVARGGPAEARECLAKFWSATSSAAQYSAIRRSLFDIFMGNWSLDASPTYILIDHVTRLFSPYDLNPMNFNPLHDVIAGCIDFDAAKQSGRPQTVFDRNQCPYREARNFPATRDPARPGGVCISRYANEQVRDKLRLSFADLGEQTVKNIARAIGVFGLTASDIASPARGGNARAGTARGAHAALACAARQTNAADA